MTMSAKDLFIAVDSDGCVFDTMEIKHKECFCPAVIKHFRLQPVSRYAREAWEFVNLYSRRRGMNRFPALVAVLDLLRVRPEVLARGANIAPLTKLRTWVKQTPKLGNVTLHKASLQEPALKQVWEWSREVNERVEDMVQGVPPFPGVRVTLERAAQRANMIVSSGTPVHALQREWQEHGLRHLVQRISGQEDGPKTHHLRMAAQGRYAPHRILMIGDAFGDLRAAQSVDACFFPVIPGREAESWAELAREGLQRFMSGCFVGAYQKARIKELEAALPVTPPWDKGAEHSPRKA